MVAATKKTKKTAPSERFHFGSITDQEISEAVAEATRQYLYDRITEEPEKFGLRTDGDGNLFEEPDVDDFLDGYFRKRTVSEVLVSIARDTDAVTVNDVLWRLPVPRGQEGNRSKSETIAHLDSQIRLMRRLLVLATEPWTKGQAREAFRS